MSAEMIKEESVKSLTSEELIAANKASDVMMTLENDPFDDKDVQIAAGHYNHTKIQIRARARNMNAGGLARVLTASMDFPYAKEYPKFKSKAEQELFLLILSMEKAKGVIASAVKSRETLQQIAVDNVTTNILEKGTL